jgi:predicted RecA/RadA family phage recombinase
MTNQIACGDVFDYIAAGAIAAGQVVVMTDTVGVAVSSGVSGDTIAVSFEGVYILPANNTQAFTIGQKLYWDATNNVITTTPTSNTFAGYAFIAKLTAGVTAQVRLIG